MKDSNGGEEITYRYQYDSIGRLIGTTQSGGTAELQAMYQYDSNNRLTRMNYSIPGIVDSGEESFYYNGDGSGMVADLKNASEGVLKGMALFSNSWILYEYDELSRLSQRRVGEVLEEHYSYLPGSESGTTTTLPETYYTTAKGSSTKLSGYRYAYDARNNITRITDLKNNSYWSYAYDEVGQLRYATTYNASGVAQDRYKYTYNRAGNLTEWKIQNGDNTETYEEHTYTYGNSEWKDLLTAYDGHTITYDVNGNPLSYYNGKSYSMSWRNGRELEQVKVGGKTYRYEYDGNGQRTRKSNEDGGYTEYYLVDGLAVAERRYYAGGSERYTMRYLYDESNSPVGLGLKYPGESLWTYFYFEKNVQGDVIGLYRSDYSSSRGYYGTLVARYSYDPYGRPVSMTNASGTTISQTAYNVAAYNPFRYRGYRYDGETGLYYLQSRYYDPETYRFINADNYGSTGQGLTGCNMFAYCNNNPVCQVDEYGDAARPLTMLVNDGGSASSGKKKPHYPDKPPAGRDLHAPTQDALASKDTESTAESEEVFIMPVAAIGANGSLIGMTGTYNDLRKIAAGTGLEVHHLIEKRFLAVPGIGKVFSSAGVMPSVILTHEQHTVYTQLWRTTYPYGQGYSKLNVSNVLGFCKRTYATRGS